MEKDFEKLTKRWHAWTSSLLEELDKKYNSPKVIYHYPLTHTTTSTEDRDPFKEAERLEPLFKELKKDFKPMEKICQKLATLKERVLAGDKEKYNIVRFFYDRNEIQEMLDKFKDSIPKTGYEEDRTDATPSVRILIDDDSGYPEFMDYRDMAKHWNIPNENLRGRLRTWLKNLTENERKSFTRPGSRTAKNRCEVLFQVEKIKPIIRELQDIYPSASSRLSRKKPRSRPKKK